MNKIINDFQQALLINNFKSIINNKIETDYNDLFKIYLSNQAFMELSDVQIVDQNYIESEVYSLPPNIDINKKYYISIYQNNEIIAVIDLLINFSYELSDDPTSIWIGLLMINGEYHHQGYGTTILNILINILNKNNINKIQIGVLTNNQQALAFWLKHQFQIKNNKPSYLMERVLNK